MMNQKNEGDCACTATQNRESGDHSSLEMLPMFDAAAAAEPCCGPPAAPRCGDHERPGYVLSHFVDDFAVVPVGRVPLVKTALTLRDRLGTLRVRMGITRDDYRVTPGLYAVGRPAETSPVLVTANYKLSFDHLRKWLGGIDAWLLVLDTRGVNVWCAAGKTTFGTAEVLRQVKTSRLAEVVSHRKLILPQLGATGVSARMVKKGCGFEIVWGPIRARDLPAFLKAGWKATDAMRRMTFSTWERLVLVPVELAPLPRPLLWTLPALFVLSGIGGRIFSFSAALERGLSALLLTLVGIFAGAVVVPLLLPWIPGRAFALKGILVGGLLSGAAVTALSATAQLTFWPGLALVLYATAVSSYLAMNFTGSTPFTSPSGVEKEMRRFIPVQLGAVVVAAFIWVGAGFW